MAVVVNCTAVKESKILKKASKLVKRLREKVVKY